MHDVIKRLLFATDFSACASHAEEYAAKLSSTCGASVDVIHVSEIYPGIYAGIQDHRETDGMLADTVRRLQRSTVPVTGHQSTGIPSVQICAAAEAWNADVIVMGTHGRTGLGHILLGSTAERVVTMAPCPVLTVRAASGSEATPGHGPIRFQHIVIPIDFSECSVGALEYGIQMAKVFGASLTLLHVLEPVFYGHDFTLPQELGGGRLDERLDAQFKTYVSTIRSAGVSARQVIRGGAPADSILEFVRASPCDLIIMGTHGRRGISRALQGSVAATVLRLAPCPVLAGKKFPRSFVS
ncbi:MAG: universal stress protein [Nitrospira sp.]|nr:universal stress protein [Nitrospira sp.]